MQLEQEKPVLEFCGWTGRRSTVNYWTSRPVAPGYAMRHFMRIESPSVVLTVVRLHRHVRKSVPTPDAHTATANASDATHKTPRRMSSYRDSVTESPVNSVVFVPAQLIFVVRGRPGNPQEQASSFLTCCGPDPNTRMRHQVKTKRVYAFLRRKNRIKIFLPSGAVSRHRSLTNRNSSRQGALCARPWPNSPLAHH